MPQPDGTCRPHSVAEVGKLRPREKSAAAAKSLQSCPTLCDPTDGSPPGSPVPGREVWSCLIVQRSPQKGTRSLRRNAFWAGSGLGGSPNPGAWDWLQYFRWQCWGLLQSGGVTREPLIKLTFEAELRAPAPGPVDSSPQLHPGCTSLFSQLSSCPKEKGSSLLLSWGGGGEWA